MDNSTLVLFTLHYPFSKVSETFLDPEVRILAKRFEKIYIIPWKKEVETAVGIPSNVEIVPLLFEEKLRRNYVSQYLRHIRQWWFFLKIYTFSILNDKPGIHYFTSAYFAYNLINSFLRFLVIKNFVEQKGLQNAVYYDYWFENSTLSLAMLKDKGIVKKLYFRGHGFDVFDERWPCGQVPFRSYKLLHCTKYFAISDYNRTYVLQKVNKELGKRIDTAYLGVFSQKKQQSNSISNAKKTFTIVSCANLLDFKRVHLIPELLNLIELPIKWYHFGDGPMRKSLLENAKSLNSELEFNFLGHVHHNKLIEFYAETEVDLSLSLSLKEGLPVSMMEALSFGIPLAGYNIFGIPEIIDKSTGLLFEENEDFRQIADRIREFLLNEQRTQENVTNKFNSRFNAELNFNKLADELQTNLENA